MGLQHKPNPNAQPYTHLPNAAQIRKALLPPGEEAEAIDELIASGQAFFHVVNNSEIDEETKNTLYRLEKHFFHTAWLLTGEDNS